MTRKTMLVGVLLGLGLETLQSVEAKSPARRGEPPAPRSGLEPAAPAVGPASRAPAPDAAAQPVEQTIVEWNADALAHLKTLDGKITVQRFPLEPGLTVDLELKSFRVTSGGTRFVVGRQTGDIPLDFDASKVRLYRGIVAGEPYSSVFLGLSERMSTGYVQMRDQRYQIYGGPDVAEDTLVVFRPSVRLAALPVERCGLENLEHAGHLADHDRPARRRGDGGASDPVFGMQVIELAVETDFEYFELSGDLDAAATYVTLLYGAVSDIYMRDVNARIELSFVRLFDNPDDEPGFMNSPDPLSPFRNYWNANMDEVHRDMAQFCSGRRDLPYGGVAYLDTLCNSWAYSVVGYVLGFFPGPDIPANGHYDISVTTHELGHNCGTLHTHDYGLDNCNIFDNDPQRGTIMSYCGQTVSGAEANIDGRFHSFVQGVMEEFINSRECIADDCNFNSVHDAIDIQEGGSEDQNGNGIPDECEDCNENGVLDDADIASATSQDVNLNGIPDECEADCNGNDLPDEWEVSQGLAEDLYGHGFPDECDADCNGDGVSDYNELQAAMSLDINRNIALDDCEDCDGDGLTDMEELDGAHNPWVASATQDFIGEFHANTGVRVKFSDAGAVIAGTDVVIDAGGRIFVASGLDDRVAEFDRSGAYLGDFVPSGSSGLSLPSGLALRPDGNLLVSSSGTNSVLQYDGLSGSFIGVFVAPGEGGLSGPFGLTFGPNGNLFVSSQANDQVIEYDGSSGEFVGVFVSAGSGGLSSPHGLTFKADGHLLVASLLSDELLEYDGLSGAFRGKFNHGGTDTNLTLDGAWGVRIGPNGNVFASRLFEEGSGGGGSGSQRFANLHLTSTRIYEYDVRNGNFLRSYITGNDTGFLRSTGFDFMPGWDVDCNVNYFPDECDIAWGTSLDIDNDGIPDECQVDCNGNGVQDRLDIIPYGSSYDCTFNGIPDECEPDCNDNGLADSCDIGSGASEDIDNNGVPDECECLPDLNGDGVVGPFDLASLLGSWGPNPGHPADLSGDGVVGPLDLAILLGAWGPCL